MRELDLAREAALLGGDIVERYYHDGVAMRSKRPSDLVSDADIESEKAIVDFLRRTFPQHAVLAEEMHGDTRSDGNLWIVDPLDGTTNFAHGLPHFAVSIAHYRQGEPVCGVVYNPVRHEWFTAARDEGAWHGEKRVHVSGESELTESLIGLGFYYDRGAMMECTLGAVRELFQQQIHGVRRFGTASLDLCLVGVGSLEAYFEYELNPWDFAAGRIFVEEAGGRVTTCDGSPLPLERSTILASNGRLHASVLEIVSRHRPDAP